MNTSEHGIARRPRVSVVMATYNRAGILRRSVDSILQQTMQDFELIIVNDASTDDTEEVLRQLRKEDERIRTFHLKSNGGPGKARNTGIRHARGTYIAIMDDDDIAVPGRLQVQAEYLDQHSSVDLVFSSVAWIDDQGKVINEFPGAVKNKDFPDTPEDVFRLLYLRSNKVPNTTIMARREVWAVRQYPEEPWVGEDWFLCMQMAASGTQMRPVGRKLVLQSRGAEHDSLMKRRRYAFSAQRKVIGMMHQWLRHEGVIKPRWMHRRARSNQFVREARSWSGFRGIYLCLRALLLAPSNSFAWASLKWLAAKGVRKVGRVIQ